VEPERAAVASAMMSETRAAARRRETAKEERPDRPCDTTIQYNTIQSNRTLWKNKAHQWPIRKARCKLPIIQSLQIDQHSSLIMDYRPFNTADNEAIQGQLQAREIWGTSSREYGYD
jgi:hypothetical protein